jgi:hypothetical protein
LEGKINMGKKDVISIEKAWEIWNDCLKGNDENSIFKQITIMIWDTAIFRLILESRQIQVGRNPDNPPLNASFHSFIDRNYFQAQVAFIRRLADKSRYGLIGRKGIYSLYSLIDDISIRRTELTREVFFELRHISYDYTKLQQGEKEFIPQQAKENKSAFWIPPEFDWEVSAEAHVTFDRLCGIQARERTPQDIISEKVFSRLKDKLDLCSDISNYVDKYIAHSATPESRIIENVDSAKITLKQVWDAHQIIYEVAEFLSLVLFSTGNVPLAWKSPTLLKNWESPLLESEDISLLELVYKKYGEETTNWQLEGVNNLWNWIEGHN